MTLSAARAFGSLPIRAATLALAVGLAAAPARPAEAPLEVKVYTLEHQPAADALPLVHPLLSERGSVQLQPSGNTLVLRDRASVLTAVSRLLEEFDHPARLLSIRIQVVRAGEGDEDSEGRLDPELARRLAELLRYDSYRLLADTSFEAREGEQVSYQLGAENHVTFQLGTLMAGQRVKLLGFEVSRQVEQGEPVRLLRTHLELWLGRPLTLGLAKNESSRRALLLVLTCTLGGGAAP